MPELNNVFAIQVETTPALGIKSTSATITGNFYQNYPWRLNNPFLEGTIGSLGRKERIPRLDSDDQAPKKRTLGLQLQNAPQYNSAYTTTLLRKHNSSCENHIIRRYQDYRELMLRS